MAFRANHRPLTAYPRRDIITALLRDTAQRNPQARTSLVRAFFVAWGQIYGSYILDKSGSKSGTLRPLSDLIGERRRLLSLWDLVTWMQSFDSSVLWKLGAVLGFVEGVRQADSYSWPFSDEISTTEFLETLSAMGAVATKRSVERLLKHAQDNPLSPKNPSSPDADRAAKLIATDRAVKLMTEIRERFSDEAEALHCFFMEPGRAQYWATPTGGWEQALAALSQEATDDVTEAGKCYACGRYTACVHHLCRVLECAFKGFSKRHGVIFKYEVERTSWEQLSEDLKAHRDTNKETLSPAEVAVINKVRDQIAVIKTLWRNPTAHSTGTFYTDEQALAIYHAVRQFAGDLVTL